MLLPRHLHQAYKKFKSISILPFLNNFKWKQLPKSCSRFWRPIPSDFYLINQAVNSILGFEAVAAQTFRCLKRLESPPKPHVVLGIKPGLCALKTCTFTSALFPGPLTNSSIGSYVIRWSSGEFSHLREHEYVLNFSHINSPFGCSQIPSPSYAI